jgi:hypothetical protein
MELISFTGRANIECQRRLVLPPAQVFFYFNGQALQPFLAKGVYKPVVPGRQGSLIYLSL